MSEPSFSSDFAFLPAAGYEARRVRLAPSRAPELRRRLLGGRSPRQERPHAPGHFLAQQRVGEGRRAAQGARVRPLYGPCPEVEWMSLKIVLALTRLQPWSSVGQSRNPAGPNSRCDFAQAWRAECWQNSSLAAPHAAGVSERKALCGSSNAEGFRKKSVRGHHGLASMP